MMTPGPVLTLVPIKSFIGTDEGGRWGYVPSRTAEKGSAMARLTAASLVALVLAAFALPSSGGVAQEGGGDTEATIAALQTQVAQQTGRLNALTTRVARLEGVSANEILDPTGAAEPTPRRPTPAPTATPRTPPTRIGQETVVDNWSLLVAGTESRDQFVGSEPVLPRGAFVIVSLEVTNTGNQPLDFPWRDLRLADGEGRLFSPSDDATITYHVYELDTSTSDELQPGLTYAFPIVFDIPPDAENLLLTSSDRVFSIDLDR